MVRGEDFINFSNTDGTRCLKNVYSTIIMYLVAYTVLFLIIAFYACKYCRQRAILEKNRLNPGCSNEEDEWLLVNKLVNEMRQRSGGHTASMNRVDQYEIQVVPVHTEHESEPASDRLQSFTRNRSSAPSIYSKEGRRPQY